MKVHNIVSTAANSGNGDTTDSQRDDLIAEIDLKWLFSGQGRWVDSVKLHSDPSYVQQILQDAVDSPPGPLHDCGVELQRHRAECALPIVDSLES